MNFVIIRNEGMSIDNAMLKRSFDAWLQPDEQIVAWHGNVGGGFVEYIDGPRVTKKIDDLAPYESAINAWIDVASRLPQALSLAQAKQIKMDVVEAFYNHRRMQPYRHWEDGYWYETTDEAIAYMTSTVAAIGLVRRFDEANGVLTYYLNVNVNLNNTSAGAIDQWSETNETNWRHLSFNNVGTPNAGGNSDGGGSPAHQHPLANTFPSGPSSSLNVFGAPPSLPGYNVFQPMNYLNPIVVISGGASLVQWQPIGAAGEIDINANNFSNALWGIINQRNALNQIRAARKNHIQNVLSDIAAVIAYPAWS